MRNLFIILGLVSMVHCSSRDNKVDNIHQDKNILTSDIRFNTVEFDSVSLKKLILTNDELLDIFNIPLSDKRSAENINAKIQSDSNRLRSYKERQYEIKSDKKCGDFRHLVISKNRNLDDFDLEPYKSTYLIIIDPNDKVVATKKLEEKSFTMGMTSMTDETSWSMTKDSVMTISSRSTFCSDMIIEGQGMSCWADEIHKVYKLSCEGLKLLKKDSTRTKR